MRKLHNDESVVVIRETRVDDRRVATENSEKKFKSVILLAPYVRRSMGLTRFRRAIRVKRSGSVKGVEEDRRVMSANFCNLMAR